MTEQHPAGPDGVEERSGPVAAPGHAPPAVVTPEPSAVGVASEPTPPSMTLWGRRAALWYLAVCALALLAMLIETVLGHAGTGTMFAAILAVPWSMLMAGLAPPLPRDWPMAAGLAVRMVPLALFMLLNAFIVASIAARSERDLKSGVSKPLVLVLIAGLLSSGCGLSSKQVVLLTPPTTTTEFFNGGDAFTFLTFDLTTVPDWSKHRGDIAAVSDLSLMGDFSDPLDGPFVPTAPVDVEIGFSGALTGTGADPAVWAGPHLEPGAQHRVLWDDGARRLLPAAAMLRHELEADGQFTLVVRAIAPPASQGAARVTNFRLGAVLQVK